MTLLELSAGYLASEQLLRARIRELEARARAQEDREAGRTLEARAEALRPLLREMRELAALTARYYERGFFHNGKYTL